MRHGDAAAALRSLAGRGDYLPVGEAFDTGGHEVRFSGFAEPAGEMAVEGLLKLLSSL